MVLLWWGGGVIGYFTHPDPAARSKSTRSTILILYSLHTVFLGNIQRLLHEYKDGNSRHSWKRDTDNSRQLATSSLLYEVVVSQLGF